MRPSRPFNRVTGATSSNPATCVRLRQCSNRTKTPLWANLRHRRWTNRIDIPSVQTRVGCQSSANDASGPAIPRRRRVSLRIQSLRRHDGKPSYGRQHRGARDPELSGHGPACTGTQSAIPRMMKDHDLLAPPTASMSPLVIRHTISVPAVWQDSLHTPAWSRRTDQLASEERSAVAGKTLLLRR
jgi:hypothetical protein